MQGNINKWPKETKTKHAKVASASWQSTSWRIQPSELSSNQWNNVVLSPHH